MRHSRVMIGIVIATSMVAMQACELQETSLTDARDMVVAEIVLRAGDTIQTAFLHRTTGGPSRDVAGAIITIRDAATGDELKLQQQPDSFCLTGTVEDVTDGTCYGARVTASRIAPGSRYTLDAVLPGGAKISGVTDVPGDFALTVPASTPAALLACRLDPGTSFELVWTRSAGASVYIAETRFVNIRQALRDAGNPEIDGGNEPLELTALSISAADTTMRFPSDIGLFDRFDSDVLPILLLIRDGLPPDVDTNTIIAAADRNYVNWVRGGNFNPSGNVHITSIQGPATGVFGSLVVRSVLISTRQSSRPPCR